MLNFDPHRWLEEQGSDSVAGVATVAGARGRSEKRETSEMTATTATVATRPESKASEADALALLRSWCRTIEALGPCQPQPGFSMGRWQKLYDCSVWWLESFGRQAALDGWGTSDVFGLVPQVEGYGGLIDQLGDHRGLVMDADTARWRWRGVRAQVYRRGSWPDLTAWWEIVL